MPSSTINYGMASNSDLHFVEKDHISQGPYTKGLSPEKNQQKQSMPFLLDNKHLTLPIIEIESPSIKIITIPQVF
jgi:hypothetical protein